MSGPKSGGVVVGGPLGPAGPAAVLGVLGPRTQVRSCSQLSRLS